MNQQFENKPECEGGCTDTEIFTSSSGKRFNKCTTCANLVFPKKSAAEQAMCDHDLEAKLCSNGGVNDGREFESCALCGYFKWTGAMKKRKLEFDVQGFNLKDEMAAIDRKLDVVLTMLAGLQPQ